MKTSSLLKVAAALLALVGSQVVQAGGEGWSADFAASKKQAAETKEDLLVDFTGSDWCGWCIKLNKEVFSEEAFKKGVKGKFVLVELDYPRDKSKLSTETIKQNEELKDKYAVRGYPTILLCDAEGRPFASTGYQKGGADAYVKHLDELREFRNKRDQAFESASKAQGVEKAKILVGALKTMDLTDGIIANFYSEVTAQIKAADPQDETGFSKAAANEARKAALQTALQGFMKNKDMEGALGLVDKTIKEGGFDTDATQQMMMTRAMILAQQAKFDDAMKAVDEAVAVAPDSEMAPRMAGFKKQIEAAKEKASKEEPAAKE